MNKYLIYILLLIGAFNLNAQMVLDSYRFTSAPIGPEAQLRGNGIEIVSGDTTPRTQDGTMYGNVHPLDWGIENFVYLGNIGTTNLTAASFNTTNVPIFNPTTSPEANIAAGDSTAIGITFRPNASGGNPKGRSQANSFMFLNDSDESVYQFNMSAHSDANEYYKMNGAAGEYFITSYDLNDLGTDMTFLALAKTDSTGVESVLLGSDTSTKLYIRFEGDDDISVQLFDGTNISSLASNVNATGTYIKDYLWHQYAVTFNGTLLKLYQDGIEIASVTDGDFTGFPASSPLRIGVRGTTSPFNGNIKQIMIWDTALSATQIADLANNINSAQDNLVAQWAGEKRLGATDWIDDIASDEAVAQVGTIELHSDWNYDIATAYNIQNETLPFGEAINSTDIKVSPNEKKVYVTCDNTDKIFQFSLSKEGDLSSATLDGSYTTTATGIVNEGITWNFDGKGFWVADSGTTDAIRYFTVATAWDLTSTVTISNVWTTGIPGDPLQITWASDGLKCWVTSLSSDKVHEFIPTTAYSTTGTMTEVGTGYLGGAGDTIHDIHITFDGHWIYLEESNINGLEQYYLPTANALSGAVWVSTFDFNNETTNFNGFDIDHKGVIYMNGRDEDEFYKYRMVDYFTQNNWTSIDEFGVRGGWVGKNSATVVSDVGFIDDYSIKVTSSSAANFSSAQFDVDNLMPAIDYTVLVQAKIDTDLDQEIFLDNSFGWSAQSATQVTTTSFTQYSVSQERNTTEGSAQIELIADKATARTGDDLWSDRIVVRQDDPDFGPPANAASYYDEYPNANNWVEVLGAATFSTDSAVGDYSIEFTTAATLANDIQYPFSVVSGQVYRWEMWAKRGASGTFQEISGWVGFATSPSVPITSTTWTKYSGQVTANTTGTATIKIWVSDTNGNAATGDSVLIDGFRLVLED
jgi:hypothetical protein